MAEARSKEVLLPYSLLNEPWHYETRRQTSAPWVDNFTSTAHTNNNYTPTARTNTNTNSRKYLSSAIDYQEYFSLC